MPVGSGSVNEVIYSNLVCRVAYNMYKLITLVVTHCVKFYTLDFGKQDQACLNNKYPATLPTVDEIRIAIFA